MLWKKDFKDDSLFRRDNTYQRREIDLVKNTISSLLIFLDVFICHSLKGEF